MSAVIPFPGTAAANAQEGRMIFREIVSPDRFFKIAGVSSWRDLMAVSEGGRIRTRGRLSIRPDRHSKEIIQEWGFEFHQTESSIPDLFTYTFEIGDSSGSIQVPMTLRVSGNRSHEDSFVCPRCQREKERWSLYGVARHGWGCSDGCFGFQFFDRGARIVEEAKTELRIDVDEMDHDGDTRRRPQRLVEISRIGKSQFFETRPDLFANIPGVFSVHVNRWHKAAGHFIADPRMLPVVQSKNVRVFDHSQVTS